MALQSEPAITRRIIDHSRCEGNAAQASLGKEQASANDLVFRNSRMSGSRASATWTAGLGGPQEG